MMTEKEELFAEIKELQRSKSKLHRRAQKAESELLKLTKAIETGNIKVDTWKSKERQQEAIERDRMCAAVEKAHERDNTK